MHQDLNPHILQIHPTTVNPTQSMEPSTQDVTPIRLDIFCDLIIPPHGKVYD